MTLPHTTGTITLTNGSPNIVGVGTDWQTAGIVGGMVFPVVAGNVLPILSVQSNTQIAAAVPWAGASGNYSYSLVRDTAYLQQLVENAELFTTIVREMRYASIASLAALAATMGGDKLAYATGPNSMAWTPFTAYGRTLVAAADAKDFAGKAQVVRRSGGSNMSTTNDVMYGIEVGTGVLIAQVDTTPFGKIWNDYYATTQGGAVDIRTKIGALSTGGGQVSGSLSVTGNVTASAGMTAASMGINTASGVGASLVYSSGGSPRWAADRTSEPQGGNNTGANYAVSRFGDAGDYLGTSFGINRRYGIVETRETPLCAGTPYGAIIPLNTGQAYGLLRPDIGFDFNRGVPGFTAGGNPGVGGRAVHVPHTAWYFIRVRITFQGAGGRSICVTRNGTPLMFAFHPGGDYCTEMMEIYYPLQANDWLSLQCTNGPINVSLEHTYFTIQFIQF